LRAGREPLDTMFPGKAVRVCGSGTQALAMALLDAKAARPSVSMPEVILPAYGCPDLVAASVYAGVRPRLVDTARGQWGYDLVRLPAALSESTVAIVAVNLLGTGDQAFELCKIAAAHGVALIQDSAQHLPQDFSAPWLGESVVLSFGRGKPLNLLRGGALLHAPARASALASLQARAMTGLKQSPAVRRLESLAFNFATDPRVYGLSRKLLGGSVGRTQYKPLEALEDGSPGFIAEVESALAGYRQDAGYDAGIWSAASRVWSGVGIEPLSCASAQAKAGMLRLRLGLLARNRRIRDEIVAALDSKGLGATAMYGESMEKLEGVPPEISSQGPFPNAADLAGRLFTLPTHSGVTHAAVQLTQATLRELHTGY
jgi:dTDP-4-amino-4,6-dideoxygalactose transaminase